MLEITFYVVAGGFAGNAFEYAIEVGDTIEPAVVGNGGDAVVISVCQLLTGLVDAHFIEERDEGVHGMFLKIAAKGLWRHMSLFRGILQRDGFIILLHDKIIDGADADTFVLAVGSGLCTG